MWKLFRNLVLGALLLTGGFVVALWAVAQQQAAALAGQFAPWGSLTFASAGAGLDGVLHLHEVHFSAKSALLNAPLSARELQVRTPGALWLLRRALTRDGDIPENLGVSLIGAQLPPARLLGSNGEPGWINPTTLVPFETFACSTAPRLASNDYGAMGLVPALPDLSVDYRYESGERKLTLDLGASSARFASWHGHAEFSEFSPAVFTEAAARMVLRADLVTLDYGDGGFFAQRNQFCAKRSNIALSTFVEQHVAAVLESLKQHKIVVAESLAGLYREAVSHGGSLHLLSLPNPGVPPIQYRTYDPEQVLRFLNLTARHDDAPPVLFKLFFLAPESTAELADLDAALVHDPLAEPAGALVVHAQMSDASVAAPKSPISNGPARPEAIKPSVTSPSGTTAVPLAMSPREAPVPSPAIPALATHVPAATVPSTPLKRAVVESPLAAKPLVEVPKPVSAPKPAPVPTVPRGGESVLPSSMARPAPNSTAALVWRGPMIERLPEDDAPREREFLVVAYDALSNRRGTRVTLITAGGKELEGTVESIEEAGITLSVQRETGRAEFYVERVRILEIRVPRPARG
ncbi:MAG: hypothetical protein ABI411_19290 [Tahibacter sp.]